ncbi:MAG: DnaJ domain-containing protein [Hyphomicrobium sp.]|nr:DnaJ domain-containing protein [Hyphomicrobium sp.]
MPFACGVEGGEVRLSPAAETSYGIVDGRDEQTVTTCTRSNLAGCRTVMVHKFTISCNGSTVAWMRVAAAIRSAAANRAWIENGRLNLVMPSRGAPETPAPCTSAARASGIERRVVLSGDCLPWSRNATFEHLVLPDGFAPVGELGARLMIGAAADEAVVADAAVELVALAPQLTQVAMTDAEIAIAKADPNAVLEPGAPRDTFETALEPDPASDDWITVVHAGADEPVLPAEQHVARTWAWLLVIASSAVIVLLLAMRLVPLVRARSARATALSLANSDLSLANASVAVAALLQQTETATWQLKGAGPLREVLQGELDHVRERLANIEKLVVKGELAPDKSALQFRALVRELERIRRIVDSALASLSNTKKTTTLPRTASEAYEVLGVNAEVSAGVLKKIVDALRMSWHPDHARDADDRVLREDRIRQINIAWELINGKQKREAA